MPNAALKLLVPVIASREEIDAVATARLIRDTRESLKLEQKTVAAHLGLSPSYICELETGRRPISEKLFNRFREAFIELDGHRQGL